MRGLGDFQRGQMKNNDPRVTEFFRCVRNAIDVLEQIVLRPSSPPAERQPEPRAEKAKQTTGQEGLKPERIAYRVNEVVKLLGLGRGTVYKIIQDEELPVIRLGRRILIFTATGDTIYRTSSGSDLIAQLGRATPRLLCSLVHKFGKKDVDDFDAFIAELKKQPSPAIGELFIFVDECHRTQSGKLHETMKALLPGAVFIGFTGTPLLLQDRKTSLEVFGNYIHTYKFGEAVEDEVVLDLVYEARDIPQQLGSSQKVDAWFEAKTKGLNDWQKAALREQWGTMQKVLSSRSRMERLVEDLIFDFNVKPRLASERGNAMLIASSIYEAAKYFELFQKTSFKGRCALVTSYNPHASDVTLEETGANIVPARQSPPRQWTNTSSWRRRIEHNFSPATSHSCSNFSLGIDASTIGR